MPRTHTTSTTITSTPKSIIIHTLQFIGTAPDLIGRCCLISKQFERIVMTPQNRCFTHPNVVITPVPHELKTNRCVSYREGSRSIRIETCATHPDGQCTLLDTQYITKLCLVFHRTRKLTVCPVLTSTLFCTMEPILNLIASASHLDLSLCAVADLVAFVRPPCFKAISVSSVFLDCLADRRCLLNTHFPSVEYLENIQFCGSPTMECVPDKDWCCMFKKVGKLRVDWRHRVRETTNGLVPYIVWSGESVLFLLRFLAIARNLEHVEVEVVGNRMDGQGIEMFDIMDRQILKSHRPSRLKRLTVFISKRSVDWADGLVRELNQLLCRHLLISSDTAVVWVVKNEARRNRVLPLI